MKRESREEARVDASGVSLWRNTQARHRIGECLERRLIYPNYNCGGAPGWYSLRREA